VNEASSKGGNVRVALREVRQDDLPVFFEDQRDPEAARMAAFPSREREAFYTHWAKVLSDPSNVVKTIVLGDAVAGNVCSWGPPEERLVGYWIGKKYWGRGVASLALASLLEVERTRPLYAHVARHNAGSIRVLQKCGFVDVDAGCPVQPDDGDDRVLVLAAR